MFELDPLTGTEALTKDGSPYADNFINEFWGWGYSLLHNPMVRGYLAEFLVYKALVGRCSERLEVPRSHFDTKVESDVHDLVFFVNKKKFTVQVKSKDSASKSGTFQTSFVRGFDTESNSEIAQKALWSDFYVFAYLELKAEDWSLVKGRHFEWNIDNSYCTDHEKTEFRKAQNRLVRSVLEINNWSFFIIDRFNLNDQKTITLSSLKNRVSQRKAFESDYQRLGVSLERMAILAP
jgi:hypothetical protein